MWGLWAPQKSTQLPYGHHKTRHRCNKCVSLSQARDGSTLGLLARSDFRQLSGFMILGEGGGACEQLRATKNGHCNKNGCRQPRPRHGSTLGLLVRKLVAPLPVGWPYRCPKTQLLTWCGKIVKSRMISQFRALRAPQGFLMKKTIKKGAQPGPP